MGANYTPEQAEKYFRERISNVLEEEGYNIYYREDRYMPDIVAGQEGHYGVQAIFFKNPTMRSIVLQGGYSELRTKFYFVLDAPYDDFENRVNLLIDTAIPYLRKKIDYSEDRRQF